MAKEIIDSVEKLEEELARVREAQRKFSTYTQEQVDKIFLAAAKAANMARIPLAKMAVEETGMGVVEDKIIKNHYAAEYIYNKYKNTKTCGVIDEDKAYGTKRIAEPLGVICAVIPTTNPTSTAIFKTLISLKTRNGIIISPHPRAKKSTAAAAKIVLDAAVAAGAPENIISWIDAPSLDMTNLLMKEADIILATGGPGMVKAAYSSGKPALGVGAGNTPAIIDESADILKAVNSIIHSKTFDNGMICASEQSTIVDKKIYKEVRKEFEYRGCYFLKKDELDKVRKTIIINGALNAKIVGQKPVTIAALAGVKIPEDTKVLIGEVESVDLSEEFAHEKLSPVLAMYKSENFEDALAKAEKLIADGGYGHTSSIYINELTEKEKLAEFEARMKTCRVLVNTPSSFGGEWWVPEKYVDRLGGADFRKLIFIDRTNQNLATLEQGDSTWLVRSMNPITTGLHRPPYKRETPPGVYVIRRKLEAMPFLRDGSIEPGGFAPWASRFSGGAYLHGVPVNYPDSVVLEYSGTLGTTPRSHMCVRNATSHAKFIYDWAPISEALVIVFD